MKAEVVFVLLTVVFPRICLGPSKRQVRKDHVSRMYLYTGSHITKAHILQA